VNAPQRIRALAVCVVRRGEEILVFEGHDPVKGETFYRALGGGIEFGETGAKAAARELEEELGTRPRDLRYLATLENIFVFDGEPGHEIVQATKGR
jgi:8-oxo-dGTP pyrophosphatase MutT (NUDIX family)